MEESLSLVEKLGLAQSPTGATIYINAATTLSFFGREEEGLRLYDRAADCYKSSNLTETYEYAALLNNRAGTLNELKRYDEAEENWKEAIEILPGFIQQGLNFLVCRVISVKSQMSKHD